MGGEEQKHLDRVRELRTRAAASTIPYYRALLLEIADRYEKLARRMFDSTGTSSL